VLEKTCEKVKKKKKPLFRGFRVKFTYSCLFFIDVSDIKSSFPEIAADFKLPELFTQGIITSEREFSSALRISSNQIQMWTHYDVMDNVLCQIVGSKKVRYTIVSEFFESFNNGIDTGRPLASRGVQTSLRD